MVCNTTFFLFVLALFPFSAVEANKKMDEEKKAAEEAVAAIPDEIPGTASHPGNKCFVCGDKFVLRVTFVRFCVDLPL
jgi:hypothetical protein